MWKVKLLSDQGAEPDYHCKSHQDWTEKDEK